MIKALEFAGGVQSMSITEGKLKYHYSLSKKKKKQ
jgi:hypothetical protein